MRVSHLSSLSPAFRTLRSSFVCVYFLTYCQHCYIGALKNLLTLIYLYPTMGNVDLAIFFSLSNPSPGMRHKFSHP